VRSTVKEHLENDATLAAVLTGGFYATREVTRQDTPAAFDDNGEIEPCLLVKLETDTPVGPYVRGSRLYFNVIFYQRSGYDVIDQALERTYDLLHRSKLTDGVWEISHADDVLDQEDEALNCSMSYSRYMATRLR
jgi:hypothetical protein